jgi:hypothetical protein
MIDVSEVCVPLASVMAASEPRPVSSSGDSREITLRALLAGLSAIFGSAASADRSIRYRQMKQNEILSDGTVLAAGTGPTVQLKLFRLHSHTAPPLTDESW